MIGIIIFLLFVAAYIYFIYKKVKKDKAKSIALINAQKEIERLNTTQNKPVKVDPIEEIDMTVKFLSSHIENKKLKNRNELIGLSINRLVLGREKFTVFVNIYNLSGQSLNLKIKDSYYVTDTKEQIRGVYDYRLISNKIDNNTIIAGFNVIRELEFISHKKTFTLEDAVIVTFDVDGYEFFLTESFDMVHNSFIEVIG